MNTLSFFQVALLLAVGLLSSITLAQSAADSSAPVDANNYRLAGSQFYRNARAANQLRNMMRIGRRSDPQMPQMAPSQSEFYPNQVDLSRFFRPNNFF
ncbi:hypothetical protein M3Y99_00785500 [Aphelenchoides fujianensis]|nr:hypothetical protein M3Y99_00785500 [Aphelenchoides fujianensis]